MEKGSEATIQINSRLWNSTLLEDYSNVDFVTIKSKGVIVIPDRNIIQSADDDIAYVILTPKFEEFNRDLNVLFF